MNYVDNNLIDNETVEYRAQLHWVIFVKPFLVVGAGLLFSAAAIATHAIPFTGVLGLVLVAIGFIRLLPVWLRSSTSEFAITNKRVLIKVGFIRRQSLDMLLGKVEGIMVDQNMVGRMFGYGTIIVAGVGSMRESFDHLARPLEFRRQLQTQLAR